MNVKISVIEKLLKENTSESIAEIVECLDDENISNRKEIIEYLVNAINKEKSNFMHWLAGRGDYDLFNDLIYSGAFFSVLDEDKNTPLHIAVKNKKYSIMKAILDLDIENKHIYLPESQRKNKLNETAFDIANKNEDDEAYKILDHYTKKFWNSREKNSTDKKKRYKLFEGGSLIESHLKDNETNLKEAVCELPKYKWLINPTGQLQWKNLSKIKRFKQNISSERWGSGVLIGDNKFLSAGHCFDKQIEEEEGDWFFLDEYNDPVEPKELATYFTVNFNYQNPYCDPNKNYSVSPGNYEIKFNVKSLIEHREGKLDYSIIELGDPVYEGKVNDFGKVTLSDRIPKNNETVVVAQHPNGEPKKIASGLVTDCKNNKLYYLLDTEGGSSGAPVGDKNKTVVTVHTSGFKDSEGNIMDERGNSGVTIDAIRQHSKVVNYTIFSYNQKNISSKIDDSRINENKFGLNRKKF